MEVWTEGREKKVYEEQRNRGAEVQRSNGAEEQRRSAVWGGGVQVWRGVLQCGEEECRCGEDSESTFDCFSGSRLIDIGYIFAPVADCHVHRCLKACARASARLDFFAAAVCRWPFSIRAAFSCRSAHCVRTFCQRIAPLPVHSSRALPARP